MISLRRLQTSLCLKPVRSRNAAAFESAGGIRPPHGFLFAGQAVLVTVSRQKESACHLTQAVLEPLGSRIGPEILPVQA